METIIGAVNRKRMSQIGTTEPFTRIGAVSVRADTCKVNGARCCAAFANTFGYECNCGVKVRDHVAF